MANYLIRSCDNRTEYVVDPDGNTIVTGTTYYFTFTGETDPICGTVISEDSNPIVDGILSATDYLDCLDCLQNPRSANTESNICLEICTESGTTVVSVTPPHPEWTDGYGTQVTELNMITLGGMNGLNN